MYVYFEQSIAEFVSAPKDILAWTANGKFRVISSPRVLEDRLMRLHLM